MPGSKCSSSRPASQLETDWPTIMPAHGDDLYVQALQLLGLHMASQVPDRVKNEAITDLYVDPKSICSW